MEIRDQSSKISKEINALQFATRVTIPPSLILVYGDSRTYLSNQTRQFDQK